MYGDKPDEHFLYLWTLPEKESFFLNNTDKLISKANILKHQNSDVYFGIGTSPRNFGKMRRCLAKDVAGIPCFWLDVDYGKNHKKKNIFKNKDQAIEFINNLPLKPTTVILSGNGIHCYWIFNEFWDFESNNEIRVSAAKKAALWNITIKQMAYNDYGFDIDSTFDLARVLRVPGTYNRKNEKEIKVEILSLDENLLYNNDSFDEFLIDEDIIINLDRKTNVNKKLLLKENAEPPFDKFTALMENSDLFKETFEGKNKRIKDRSPSGYDMSLACQAIEADWEDQEIVDLLISKRRSLGQDLKLRESYYLNTLFNARKGKQKSESLENLSTMEFGQSLPQQPVTKEDKQDKFDEIKEDLSSILNIDILRIIKFLGDEPNYRVVTEQGEFSIGSVENLIEQRFFKRRVAAFLNILIPTLSAKEWDNIAQSMLYILEERDIGSENTTKGAIQLYLDRYLADYEPADCLDDDVILSLNPYEKDGNIYIFAHGLREWLHKKGEHISTKNLGQMLRIYGALPELLNCKINDKPTTRSVWRLPI